LDAFGVVPLDVFVDCLGECCDCVEDFAVVHLGLGCVKNLEQSLVFFFFHAAVAARSFSWSCQVWTGVR
jgi:hypothetical protein